jgi:hypothetical protein
MFEKAQIANPLFFYSAVAKPSNVAKLSHITLLQYIWPKRETSSSRPVRFTAELHEREGIGPIIPSASIPFPRQNLQCDPLSPYLQHPN